MRIPPETIRSLVGLYSQRVGRTQQVGPTYGAAGVYRSASPDATVLSEEASLLNTLKQGVKEMPEVDDARVERARRELASDSFDVDPMAVAAGLIRELSGV